ncbi:MAG: hypothetical protein KA807_10565 [Prolixibacteraceae bacterium]|jgi:hypothetical protein|nr:hypothetical protein [Prolixibacteraceae bacterium]
MKKRTIVTLSLAIAICLMVSDLHAPEITQRDILGYDPYRVAESGAILDTDGAIRGWVLGSTVYDPSWDKRYVIPRKIKRDK